MADPQDRAITVTFSMRISSLDKLQTLTKVTGKNRSELLDLWLEREFTALTPEPAELEKEMTR